MRCVWCKTLEGVEMVDKVPLPDGREGFILLPTPQPHCKDCVYKTAAILTDAIESSVLAQLAYNRRNVDY